LLSDIFNYNSKIYCDLYLISLEELIYNDFKNVKLTDFDKNERMEDIRGYQYKDFLKQKYFKAEIETINSLVKNFGILLLFISN